MLRIRPVSCSHDFGLFSVADILEEYVHGLPGGPTHFVDSIKLNCASSCNQPAGVCGSMKMQQRTHSTSCKRPSHSLLPNLPPRPVATVPRRYTHGVPVTTTGTQKVHAVTDWWGLEPIVKYLKRKRYDPSTIERVYEADVYPPTFDFNSWKLHRSRKRYMEHMTTLFR